MKVLAIQDFPSFVGRDMKEYNGLMKGQSGEYPKHIAELLVHHKCGKVIGTKTPNPNNKDCSEKTKVELDIPEDLLKFLEQRSSAQGDPVNEIVLQILENEKNFPMEVEEPKK